MRPSKTQVFNLVLVSLILSACTKPTKGPDDSSGATFYVNSLNGTATQNVASNTVWKIPQSVTFTFQVCLSARASRKDLYAQDFLVENPVTKQMFAVKTAENNGCFNWTEDIAYNHFAGQSGWVVIERTIVGRGVNLGKQTLQIAINPWAAKGDKTRDAGDAVVYMAPGNARFIPKKIFPTQHSMRALSGEFQGSSRLLVQNVKVKSIPEGEGGDFVTLRVEVTMDPVVQSSDANGQVSYEKIKDGDFNLMMQVLASNVGANLDQKMILLGGNRSAIAHSMNGQLHAEFVVRQEKRANQGNLELVMNIKPAGLNAFATLRPFNGMFRFGPGIILQDESGTLANMCQEDDASCSYENIISKASNYEELNDQGYARSNERYIFSNLKLRFVSVLGGETATRRTVLYGAQTCITDLQTGKPLAGTPLTVEYTRDPNDNDDDEPLPFEQKTDESGCLNWNGRIFHKYYQPEHYYKKEVTIRKGSGFTRKVSFYLNPWDDKFTFGFDEREFNKGSVEKYLLPKKIRTRFFLGEYNYHTVRFLYNVDQYMDLEVHKTVLMGLVPQVLRYSGIINARKMVEKLRDGIYLMKVGIQKSYLDPRDNSGWLLHNTPQFQAKMESVGSRQLRPKEFVTTNMALVRVVDGVIIYPMELTMRDLRLMRVRSNFLIQLETVDERMIQAYHAFKRAAVNDQDLVRKLEEFKARMGDKESLADVKKQLDDQTAPDLERFEADRNALAQPAGDMDAARQDLEARVQHVQEMIKDSLKRLKDHFEQPGTIGYKPGTKEPAEYQPGASIIDSFELREDFKKELKAELKISDFSGFVLPKKEDVDLNLFLEKDSGLDKRTFVGPVIFLSNAYSDSMRATDNLDEANCPPFDPKKQDLDDDSDDLDGRDGSKDTLNESIEALEQDYDARKLINKSEAALFGNRQNNAYQYNKYFSSLHHLCNKSVDQMVNREAKLKNQWQNVAKAASLKYNFADNFNLDFISLTNEPLKKVRANCEGDVDNCLEPTDERTVKAEALDELIHRGLTPEGMPAGKSHWDPQDYQKLFYDYTPNGETALCNIVANSVISGLKQNKAKFERDDLLRVSIMRYCTGGGLVHDIKYHVEQTGKYAFRGGLNLNFNVGEGFSVGTSSGWSAGVELTDMVGTASALSGGALKAATAILKPLNLKYGTGLSSSEGTSISESTYLVSQIAGFDVELTKYERCTAIRLTDAAIKDLNGYLFGHSFLEWLGWKKATPMDGEILGILERGYFICEGATREQNAPETVKEDYFYFTQHFTEGDMLDQADLYNHPWLLALRGMRDFSVFVDRIRGQQIVNLPQFVYGLVGKAEMRPHGWALNHLRTSYHKLLPSYPGFYTKLRPGEPDIEGFALDQEPLSKIDRDTMREVTHPKLMQENSDHITKPVLDQK